MSTPEDPTLQAQCRLMNATCAATNLRRASRALTQLYAALLAPSGLEPTQLSFLVACALAGPVPITALAETLALDRTTLARNLQPLQKQGLVQVVPGADRRVRVVTLTEAGRQRLQQALPLWAAAQAQVVRAFGQERLTDVLAEVAALAAAARPA